MEAKPVVIAIGLARDGEVDRATLGELGGVAEQVEEDLLHPCHIGMHLAERIGATQLQCVVVSLEQRADGAGHIVDQCGYVEGLQIQLDLAGLDLGEVEDIVDQREQVIAGRANLIEVGEEIVVAAGTGPHLEQLAITEDRRQGRAQLVAHIRQERALGAAGGFGGLFGAIQFLLDLLAVGDITQHDQPPAEVMLPIVQGRDAQVVVALHLVAQSDLGARLGHVAVALD